MKVNQIYSILNDISEQTFGESAPTATDLSGLISMGETINSSTDKDKFFGALVDRIGRTIIRTLDLSVRFPKIMYDSFEFGAVLQKITVEPMDAVQSEPWRVGVDNPYAPNQFAITKATVRQSLFSGINVWSVKTTIPDSICRSAFTSEGEMAAFFNGIIDSMEKSMIVQISEMNRMCVNNFIAKKCSEGGAGVVHLASEYNDDMGLESTDPGYITLANAAFSKEFLRYSAYKIGSYMRYLRNPSTLFNLEGVVRETQRDNMHVFMLGEFASSAFNGYLLSDTFHEDLTQLPLYEEVDFWQSMTNGSVPNLASSSTISVKLADAAAADDPVTVQGVVAALIDRQAIGTTAYNVRTTTDRNNDGEYTNYSHKCDIGYFNDQSENGVIFCID